MVRLHDIMTVNPVAIDPQATLREAAELLASEHVSGLPVLSGSEWTLGQEMGIETRGLDAVAQYGLAG